MKQENIICMLCFSKKHYLVCVLIDILLVLVISTLLQRRKDFKLVKHLIVCIAIFRETSFVSANDKKQITKCCANSIQNSSIL